MTPSTSTVDDTADRFCALACLAYDDTDDPERWAQAADLLAADPGLPGRSLYAAAAAGDSLAVRDHLADDPGQANAEGGPFGWAPLLYVTYSRVTQSDPVGTAELLLDAGADPNAGYLWQGLTPPFTALTGVFGEGEQGPGRQPRHPAESELARLLLDRGAEASDGQALYNRMFGRDDGHLELLFAHGLGRGDGGGDGGVWRRRLGDALETVEEMMARQVAWALDHGFESRLALLAAHGFPAPAAGDRPPSVHRAGSAAAVAAAVQAGADVDEYREGHTALHHAAWIGDEELVEALLAAGADPALRDRMYAGTPLDWAEHGRQPATARLLRTDGPSGS